MRNKSRSFVALSLFVSGLGGCDIWGEGGIGAASGVGGSCPFDLCEGLVGGSGGVGGNAAGGMDGVGGVGGEAPPPPVNDQCAGASYIDLAPGGHAFEHGTVLGAADDYRTFCADSAQASSGLRDVVYQLSLSGECSTTISLDGASGFDGALSLRSSSCEVDEYCSQTPGSQESFVSALLPGTYWIVVTANDGEVNDFTLSVQCDAPACGDGILNETPGEECDDGNTMDGDGCDASCTLEQAAAELDTCIGVAAGEPVAIASGELLRLPGDGSFVTTLGATDSGTGSCSLPPDHEFIFPAPDHVVRVRPSQDGTLRATLGLNGDGVPFCGPDALQEPAFPFPTGCYDRALHVREACEDVGSEVACSDSPDSWWTPEEVSFPVLAGQDYYVFVDGWNGDEFGVGQYVLELELE